MAGVWDALIAILIINIVAYPFGWSYGFYRRGK